MEHEKFERMIERHFVDDLTSAQTEELHRHLRDCSPCAGRYQRCADAERAFGGGGVVSLPQRDRLEARLLSAVRTKRRPDARWPLALAAAAAGLAAVVLLPASEDEFTSRGGGAPEAEVELRALAVRPTADRGFEVRSAEEVVLRPGDHLRLSYRNRSAFDRITVEVVRGDLHLTLLDEEAIDRSDEAKLGAPIPAESLPVGRLELRATFFEHGAPERSGRAVRTAHVEVGGP